MANKQINDLPVGVSIDPDDDSIPFWDAGAGVTRRITPSDMFSGSFAEINHTHSLDHVSATFDAAIEKTPPVDDDTLPLADSTAGNVLRKLSWANVKATLKTYFDTLYATAANIATHAGLTATHGATGAIVGTTNAQTLTNKTLGSTNISTLTEKTTPVDADSAVIADSAASSVFKRVTYTNVKAFLKSYFDTLYVALTGAQTVAGAKTFTSAVTAETAGQALNATRLATSTNQLSAVANFKAKVVGTMADGFGTGFLFRGEDTDAVDNPFVLMGGIRDGADNTGRFRLFVYLAGVAQQVLDITAQGFVGIGATLTQPQGMLHAHDGTGGFMFVTKTGVNATAQTIIPDGTGDITKICLIAMVATDGTGTGSRTEIALVSGGTTTVSGGGSVATVTFAASGALTIVRTTGSGTLTVAIKLIWL